MTMINKERAPRLGIYLHIPFCVRRCPYCGFYSQGLDVTSSRLPEEYRQRLLASIRHYGDPQGFRVADEESKQQEAGFSLREHQVDSIFFGGGTPTLLPASAFAEILAAIRENFRVSADCEITTEANPGTIDREKLRELKQAGVNRLSIGVQSFADPVLKTLGRIHTAAQAEEAFYAAREAGFDNINLDLMFAIPGQSRGQWIRTLEKAIALAPEHLSFYSLQIEEGTPYYRDWEAGKLRETDDVTDRAMYHDAIRVLEENGYRHYEISNAAKPGFECRHNLKYWQGEEYLGVGDSAASYLLRRDQALRGEQSAGEPGTGLPVAELEKNRPVLRGVRFTEWQGTLTDVHFNSEFDDWSEYAFTALRLRQGLDYGSFRGRFGIGFREAFADRWGELDEFFAAGYLKQYVTAEGQPTRLVLTEAGIDISNRIMAVFV